MIGDMSAAAGSNASDASPTRLRFGVNLGRLRDEDVPGATPTEVARWAEGAGFDLVTAADHVGHASPLLVLAAAAAVTTTVRLRSYVLDHGFWNPGLLARDVATLDAISGGRVDVGLGLGHMPAEHAAVGLPFPPYAERVQALTGFVRDLRDRLADPQLRPRPVQQRIPMLIGAMSRRGLELAAREADVVALSGLLKVPGKPAGTFTIASDEQADDRMSRVRTLRQAARLPDPEIDVLIQQVQLDRPPAESAAELSAQLGYRISPHELLDSPFVLFADGARHAAEILLARSRRWGIGSWCTHHPSGPALARVNEAIRA
jgi:probable F420-dependent oxidoreductase